MLERVRSTIHKYSMFAPGDRVLVGVSGGPDSVVLLHVLKSLAPKLMLELFVAHLNHGLRGQAAAEDAEFVREMARRLEVPAVVESKDVAGFARENTLSVQEAAREVRYRFFLETAKQLGCGKLATGHNANDQAETVLFQFLRGSGVTGLGGIPPVRDGWIVRPLIEIKREEIEQYCLDHQLPTRTDQSNLKTVYTRNKIRLQLIPYLEQEYNINLVETLLRTSEIMRDQEEFVAAFIPEAWAAVCVEQADTRITFSLTAFLQLPAVLQTMILRQAWERLTGSGYKLGFVHLTKSLALLRSGQTGSMMDLPAGIRLTKSYREFCISAAAGVDAADMQFSHILDVPGITAIPETGDAISSELLETPVPDILNRPDEILVDLDLVPLPLTVRSRRPGDRFRPQGQQGTKKLKKYLIDCKVPRQERSSLPVLVGADGQVIWIAGLRADERWRVSPETKKALKLKLIRNVENKIENITNL